MTPIDVLKILKTKIDELSLNKINYVIEENDIKLINESLSIYDDNDIFLKCDKCGCHPNVIIRTQFGTFCQLHARYV